MTKKKIDNRIRTLIENCVHTKHRSLFVLVGDHGKDQIPNLHYILSKSQVAKRPSVLWCYKKDLGFSSHRQKRMKQMKKMKQLGLAAQEAGKEDDPFEMFLSSTDIRYTYYSETDKILGQTFGMCILSDFEALTPNLLARTIETVQGGGMVVLLLKTLTSLKQLYTMVMDVHSRYRSETKHEPVARFNERFLLSLSSCETCLVLDDELTVLPLFSSSREITPVDAAEKDPFKTADELALEKLKEELSAESSGKSNVSSSLVSVCKTLDQAKTVQGFAQILKDHKNSLRTTVSLTAGRGRGKSASLGLALAAAVSNGYGNIFVTAPSPENLKTLFDFLFKGLDALGFQEHLDYDIIQSTCEEFNKAVVRVNIFKADHRQTIMYIHPQDTHLVSQAELVLIDEAAAIPLPLVQALSTGSHLVFMASTINGYEGTGRSLSLKLIQQLRAQSTNLKEGLPSASGSAKPSNLRLLKEFQLSEPIRYANGDPVEKWLNTLLCLDSTVTPSKLASMPHPEKCELFAVNRDTLFSYHKASEIFLQRMVSLYVSSHYKNTPNDLQLMSDAPAHRLYVLLAPVDERSTTSLPDILCVLQVCHEGQISKQVIMNSLARGKRSGGDLIPWTISQQFQDDDFASLSGARIVRVAVHPDMQNMGYGSRALQLLEQFYTGALFDADADAEGEGEGDEDDEDYVRPGVDTDGDLHSERLKPRANLQPLLVNLRERRPIKLHWLGVSFGLTSQLFKFWKRLGMLPVYLRQTTNDITGEHTMIMMKGLLTEAQVVNCSGQWLGAFYEDFRKRFVNLLGFQFRTFSPVLCLDILEGAGASVGMTVNFTGLSLEAPISAYDLKRLESYAGNMIDYHMIMDLVPALAREYFLLPSKKISLSPVQAAILLCLGLQQRVIEDLEKDLKLPVSQLLAMLIKCMKKFATWHREQKLCQLEGVPPTAVPTTTNEQSGPLKRSLEEEWDPTEQALEDDLEEAADEATARLRSKQRDLINALDLDKYKIGGTEEEWSKEIQKKAKNLKGSVMNISANGGSDATGKKKSTAKEVMAEGKKAFAKKGKTLKR